MTFRACFLFLLFVLSSCRPQTNTSIPPLKREVVDHQPKQPTPMPVSVSRTPEPIHESDRDNFLICLDAGHGGQDPGTRRKKPPFLSEKQLALSMSLQIEKYLTAYGYTVYATRRKDLFVPLPERVLMAQKKNALVFVSIHFNWAKNTACRGIEVFFFDKKNDLRSTLSKRAAEKIMQQITKLTPFPSRGVKHGNYCVIRETTMPAVLIEAGFFSNPKDVQLLKQRVHRMSLAKAIAKGIDEFCRMER